MSVMPQSLPKPHDQATAEALLERFAQLGPRQQGFAESDTGQELLRSLGGHSPYLAQLAERESATLMRCAEKGPDDSFTVALDSLGRADPTASRVAVASLLRQAKRQAALIVAIADISGMWMLDRVTGALSNLAEATLDFACAHLLLEAAARGELRLPRSSARDFRTLARGSGLSILGMGKLGAQELNYSSDIDLLVLYDPQAAASHIERASGLYVRLTRDLVRLMEERTADGYVFRTDLRLRPDPAATPLAVSIPTAITYYESMGQNWERAAMIKARPVAGDRTLGESFLSEIRPFIWRRHLDFATIADFQSIKHQIHAAHEGRGAHKTVQVAGHNVKLGRGGIREIEFTTQVLQLIWAGRDPTLRDPSTLGALAALSSAGKIDRRAAADLADAYVFLRQVEHRLQMVEDRQTHQLPDTEEGLKRIASFMGYDDSPSFAAALTGHLMQVEQHYAHFFEQARKPATTAPEQDEPALTFPALEGDKDMIAHLTRMGFQDGGRVAAVIRGWQSGQTRASRSERARGLLRLLLPDLLKAFADQPDPDAALIRFDAILSRLSAGVQVLSLFQRNPPILYRVAGILGAAPALSNHLAQSPASLEGLLSGSGPGGAAAVLPALLKTSRHLEEALDGARRLVTEGKFEIDAAALEGVIDVDAAGLARSDLADAAINALLPHVTKDFAERFGKVKGGRFGVIAMGKLGGREMLPGSDLDLILIYDHPEGASDSAGGRRSLPASVYYGRLAQQVIAAITAPGAEGKLYEVDMRLRPSGNKGPVATSLSSFRRYHAESAWTWERMALTRSRCVAGAMPLRRHVAAAVKEALVSHAGPQALADAVAMRARMLRDLPPDGPWDLKARSGGLIEVEFIAQSLQLAYAASHPGIMSSTTHVALSKLAKAGLLSQDEAGTLIGADRLFRTLTGLLRLTVGRWRHETLPHAVASAVLRGVAPVLGGAVVDLAELRKQIDIQAEHVRAIFERRLGRLNGATE